MLQQGGVLAVYPEALLQQWGFVAFGARHALRARLACRVHVRALSHAEMLDVSKLLQPVISEY